MPVWQEWQLLRHLRHFRPLPKSGECRILGRLSPLPAQQQTDIQGSANGKYLVKTGLLVLYRTPSTILRRLRPALYVMQGTDGMNDRGAETQKRGALV